MYALADGVQAFDLVERPDLLDPALALGGAGVPFLNHDLAGQLASLARFRRLWPRHSVVLVRDGVVLARACSVPLCLGIQERERLPDHGWDGALIWAVADRLDERPPNAACGIDIQVGSEHRGQGIAGLAVDALLRSTERAGLAGLVVPVRPPDKASEPFASMYEYARRVRSDGLPADRWLRVHVRAGGRLDRVAPYAMTVTAGLDQWRRWTGEPFDLDGPVAVAGGLSPVISNRALDLGVYVEPNVWVRHSCR